jgi:NDP-sugar pyrophosphorylase family protein
LEDPGLQGITAAILAGGFGTRLRSVVSDRPKILAQVRGRPFVYYLLDQLADAGVSNIVLCTGYLAEQVEDCLGNNYRGIELRYSVESEPLGTGGALRFALHEIPSPRFLVMNGDSYCGADLRQLVQVHMDHAAQATMVVSSVNDTSRFGSVQMDSNGEVVGFAEKQDSSGSGWVNAGIYVLERAVIAGIPPDANVSLEREVFPALLGKGLFACQSRAALWDIGVPDTYARAQVSFEVVAAEREESH